MSSASFCKLRAKYGSMDASLIASFFWFGDLGSKGSGHIAGQYFTYVYSARLRTPVSMEYGLKKLFEKINYRFP